MTRHLPSILTTLVVALSFAGNAEAGSRPLQEANFSSVVEAAPTLAPFQHVRFCLRYPSECKTGGADELERIELSTEISELLTRVNHSVNMSIRPVSKTYGSNLGDGWTIAPDSGDCNDYAVTKRHELVEGGLPSKALRLAVVKTGSDVGHLVLVIATTRGDLVLDNLTETIRPWQRSGYRWLKIQSASNAKFWYEVKHPSSGASVAQADQKVRLADR